MSRTKDRRIWVYLAVTRKMKIFWNLKKHSWFFPNPIKKSGHDLICHIDTNFYSNAHDIRISASSMGSGGISLQLATFDRNVQHIPSLITI